MCFVAFGKQDCILADLALPDAPSRAILADLASLDGAAVVSSTGRLLAYGSIIKGRQTEANQAQGARTRAAFAASNYGVAIKVSSDGEIAAYFQGEERFKL